MKYLFCQEAMMLLLPKIWKRMKPNHFDTSMETLIPKYDYFFVLMFCVFRMRRKKTL